MSRCTRPGTIRSLLLPDLPYASPNTREHRQEAAALNAEWRRSAGWLAKADGGLGRHDLIWVRLTLYPGDRRRRDPDNLIPGVQKPVVDGLVDAGVVPDDTQDHVDWSRPMIFPPIDDPKATQIRQWVLHVECRCHEHLRPPTDDDVVDASIRVMRHGDPRHD